MPYVIAAFYRFTPLPDISALRDRLRADLAPYNLCGSLLLAPEGINGTIAGDDAAIDALLAFLQTETGLKRDEVKFSAADAQPFLKFKIRLKREIITFNQPSADPANAGIPVAPGDWNELINDPDVVLLDTRNNYETMIGSFRDAVIPPIEHFTEFANFTREKLDPAKHKKIAMFCTGGIRCEKASSFMKAEGFAEVYHLQGGILKYLEDIPPETSRWDGACYVFDRRMSVEHGLKPGAHRMCCACGYPIEASGLQDTRYEEGVSCAHCFDLTDADDKARYRMRQQQWQAV